MKILHVWNQAGVASILAKYQRKLGHEAEVIKREGFDRYGIEEFYGTTIYRGSAIGFYRYAINRSKSFDVIHIHSLIKLVPFIRKPFVLHLHGSELRNVGIKEKILLKCVSSDKVLVSTPDLLCILPKATWLPNPVDTEHFYPRKPKSLKLKLPVSYDLMPDYLLHQEIYVGTHPWCICKTSLEALACGITVKWNELNIKPPLPEQHKPERVVEKTIKIYEAILR